MNGDIDRAFYPSGDYNLAFINQGIQAAGLINVEGKGLSLSRNVGISLSKPGDIVVLTDNDVSLCSDFAERIAALFLENKDADIITFKANNKDFTPFKPDYKVKKTRHNHLSIMKVSSIEIAFKLTKKIPSFDTSYGLGSTTPIGEENIFLSDCLKNGCLAIYVPETLVRHVDDSHSGSNFTLDLTSYRKKVFTRIYGRLIGKLINVLFLLKNKNKLIGGLFKHLINK